jgi:hypothetical protein
LRLRVDETSTPAPPETAIVVNGSRVLLLTRSCTSLENVHRVSCRWPRTGRGHREGSRSHRAYRALSALVVSVASEPRYVCGAATLGHQQTQMKTAHVARCRRRWASTKAEKKEKSALRSSLSLDNGGPSKELLPRMIVTEGSP